MVAKGYDLYVSDMDEQEDMLTAFMFAFKDVVSTKRTYILHL